MVRAAYSDTKRRCIEVPICLVEAGPSVNIYTLDLRELLDKDNITWRETVRARPISDEDVKADLVVGQKFPITYRTSKSWYGAVLKAWVHEVYPGKIAKSKTATIVKYNSYNNSEALLNFVKEELEEKVLEIQVATI